MIYCQSENCITIDFTQVLTEKSVFDLEAFLVSKNIKGWIEAVPTYTFLSIYFDVQQVDITHPTFLKSMKNWINEFKQQPAKQHYQQQEVKKIPVCYEAKYALDLEWAVEYTGLTKNELISYHCAPTYEVKMLGFIPGFPYLGFVSEEIQLPRLKKARSKVLAGSIGIAAAQTGIYPIDIPGGWRIIGRTPLLMFDKFRKAPFLLSPLDLVEFYPISEIEFEQMNQHLS